MWHLEIVYIKVDHLQDAKLNVIPKNVQTGETGLISYRATEKDL